MEAARFASGVLPRDGTSETPNGVDGVNIAITSAVDAGNPWSTPPRRTMKGGALRVALSSSVFVLSGLVQTVCVQAVLYSGGGDRSTLLVALPNYVGILLVYVVGARIFRALDRLGVWCGGNRESNRVHTVLQRRISAGANPKVVQAAVQVSEGHEPKLGLFARAFHRDRRRLFVLAFNEIGGFVSGITGLAIAGSGLYQVIFSGGTVFTALLSSFFLRRRLTSMQWVFIALITLGLLVTAEQFVGGSRHGAVEADAHAAEVISGVAFVLVSCLFYSTNHVMAEYFLDPTESADTGGAVHSATVSHATVGEGSSPIAVRQGSAAARPTEPIPRLPPPSGLDLSLYTGGTCLLVFGSYVIFHTVPRWDELVTRSIHRHRSSSLIILEQYLYLTIASFLHAVTHYDVVATVGAVPVGILNAIRAVSVFAVSAMLFCEHQASQCYNTHKGMSTGIVIIGAMGYSITSVLTEREGVPRKPSGGSQRPGGKHRNLNPTQLTPHHLARSWSLPYLQDTAHAVSGARVGAWLGLGLWKKAADG